jgi:hypothetical protein
VTYQTNEHYPYNLNAISHDPPLKVKFKEIGLAATPREIQ